MESQTPAGEPKYTAEEEAQARAIIEKGFEDGIDAFYAKVQQDDVIGPVFLRVVHDWPSHKRTMVDFWSRVVLGTERYTGLPLPPHVQLKLDQTHFDRWLKLWKEACEETMPEPLAAHVLKISTNMSNHWVHALKSVAEQIAAMEKNKGTSEQPDGEQREG